MRNIKVITLDVTGTIIHHRHPIPQVYADSMRWAGLPNPPDAKELKPAFKKAYYDALMARPYFGHAEGLSSRQWWVKCVKMCLDNCGRNYTDDEFNRFFRHVY